MLPSSSLLRAPGAIILLLLVVCVSLSDQLSGLSLQPASKSGRNSPQLVHFNFNKEELRESSVENGRKKRDVHTEESLPIIETNITLLNDSHNSLIVYWAGKDVIICLAKDVSANSASTLHISRNYGATFEDATDLLSKDMPDGVKPILDKFFNHPTNNGKFIFTDVKNNLIFTTDNYGAEFRRTSVLFVPDEILFDPYAEETIVAYEKNTTEKHMWISKDFGVSWTMVQELVKSVSWDESTHPAKLYIQREEPDEKSSVLTSVSAFVEHGDVEVKFNEVEEFEIKDEYMFATKKGANNTLELWISYKRGPFLQALFPTHKPIRNYHIADVFDGQMFVCVTHENSISDLYVGSRSQSPQSMENPRFSLSLRGIVFFKPNMTWSESWIDDVTDDSFVELHRVEGLRGVYIANVLKNTSESTNNKINLNEIISQVTFDNGGEWQVLKPPEFDDDGQPLYCHLVPRSKNGENCSLQINQRLSELFPVTRAVPILSRKSAVGIIMATGTVNNSLKGHQGVFMSTDGAVTWKHLLQGNYLFGFGDHGGVIVAVKFYKLGDATDSLLYSINEGETWKKYKFYDEKVRVLGLMTEPGENTTVFFVFGSISKTQGGKTGHSWILIKVDLLNAFEGSKCNASDYKLWSPWDSKTGRDCLLGKKDHYERRIPSHGCYNGRSYERLVNTTKCLCDRVDFECDFGYVEDELNGQVCKKDTSDFSPGVKPEWCKPGDLYYNITRGYRKIPGDECEGGDVSKFLPETKSCAVSNESEFMLVAKRDSVLRIDLYDFNHTEVLPLLNVRAVISMDYDMHSGDIYWADVNRDNVMRLKLDGNSEPETLISTDLKSVEGLAFDWIAKNLYYCDAANARIEVIRTDVKNMGRMRKIVLDKTHLDKPRGIVVHPEKGYLFWTDWSSNNPCIGRSWLDGSNVKRIVENPAGTGQETVLRWPNGIAIDYEKNNIYWVDAFLDHLALADFDGKKVKIFIKQDYRLRHPFAVSVYKDTIYWDDWNTHSIFGTRKDTDDPGKGAFLVTANHTRLMDLKIYGPGRQVGTNACSNHSCSHLCLSYPDGQNFTCECPDGLKKSDGDCVCPDGKPTEQNGQCNSNNCNGNATFTCKNAFCIPLHWKCDGDDDCGDNSDEDSSTCDPENKCNPAQFQCVSDHKCIPDGWRCDYDNDCADGSDEHNCTDMYPICDNVTHFHCANNRCILSRWKCDGDNDCMDNSDELNCTTTPPGTCALNEFRCESSKRCISDQWRCDGDNDCGDDSDEKNCSTIACPDYKFHCKESNQCIMESWHCDGDTDCTKGEDERNCSAPVTIPPAIFPFPVSDCSKLKQTFQCTYTKKCIPTSWRCDGQFDCGQDDHTDELGCEIETSTTKAPVVTIEPHEKRCELDSWQCVSGDCIRYGNVCDGYPDCADHSDEQSCRDPNKGPTGCAVDHIRCGLSNVCIAKSKVCNGKKDCPNNADESACFLRNSTSENQCNSGQHVCDDNICVPLSRMCNGNTDCLDGTDEVSCGNFQKVYQVEGIQVNPEGVDASEIEIEWWIDPDLARGKELYYIPSYCEVKSNDCVNASKVIRQAKYKFTKLVPFTRYNVTVYVGYGLQTFPPSVYKLVNTIEYDPSPPYQLELRQPNVDELCARWKKPHTPNGIITKYFLHFSPPPQPASEISLNESLCLSNKQSDPPFQPGMKYTFWVVAENSVGRSDRSETVTYVFKGDAGKVVDAKCKDITESSATLTWTTSSEKSVQHLHYNVTLTVADTTYPFNSRLVSENTYLKVKALAPGTQYQYEIIPIHEDGIRGVSYKGQFQTKGVKLPTVDGIKTQPWSNSTNVFEVSWIKPVNNKPAWKYAVFFGKTINEIVQKNNPMKVSAFPVLLKNLEACEDYFVDVAVVENDAVGPLTEKPLLVKTGMDVTAPPKRLRIIDPQDKFDDVKVTVAWESPCPVMDKKIGYNITLRDVRLNNEFGLSNISYSNASYLKQRIDIQYGGRYEVTVSTSAASGRNSAPVVVQGPDIPFPRRVRQCAACLSPTIVWELPTLPKKVTAKGNITYVVWLSRDEKFSKYSTFSTNEAVFPFKDVLEEGIYFIAVSIRDSEGLESPRSSPIILQGFGTPGGSSAVTLDERSLVGIVVTVIVVLAILIAALSVFIVRHKRLQTSFLNFASSHYSTQSGSATFQQNLEEEQDSPVIRGFSDDEPLLVA